MIKEFNKKNLEEFADYLYKETKDEVEYVPLICDTMAAVKGKKMYCCVTAELYTFFFEKLPYNFGPDSSKDNFYCKSENDVRSLLIEISNCDLNKEPDLQEALVSLVEINDKGYNTTTLGTEEEQITRAKRCSKKCKEIAKKFLK